MVQYLYDVHFCRISTFMDNHQIFFSSEMDIPAWLITFVIIFIILLVLLGQSGEAKGCSLEVSPSVLKRGINKTAKFGKGTFSKIEEVSRYSYEKLGKRFEAGDTEGVGKLRENLGKRYKAGDDESVGAKEGFMLAGETYPEMKDRVDVFGTDVPIGEETAARLHSHAFLTDVTNRSESLRLSTPQVQRETPAEHNFLWTGTYDGQEEIQSNPFVKVKIRNHPAHEGRDPFSYERL